ncbi:MULTISPECIES: AsmA-like C-terminal region-containing protein [unclassified Devosia]|uniref:AsmA family protein n=1 Tax=unclassified Devosia TaxID=196773 RepID=UPI001554C1BD
MLNRIYIIIGTLAIIVLAGAFIAPYFIRWSDYRGRMEELATSVLGTPVTVRGDIAFSLLPNPRLEFSDVLVGSPEEPAATVGSVEAEFSLMDFLRDNYNVTRLVLREPVIDFTVDESGLFGSGVDVSGDRSAVALQQASIVDATIRLADRRAGDNFVLDDLDGELRLASFSGPFQFQGNADYADRRYALRFNAAVPEGDGSSRVSFYLEPVDRSSSLSLEGVLLGGMAPKLDGRLVYRQTPPAGENADAIHGDLVFESPVSGSADRIVLSGYTLQPDETRAGTRLTGAASIQLGAQRSFDAVISGGVFALPPRDAYENTADLPYELVRMLAELPAAPVPQLPGRIGVDLAEVGLRGFALRNLRLDARSDGSQWRIEQLIARLPGETELRAQGMVTGEGDQPVFTGELALTSQRLDALAQLWRKPAEDNPLFNQPGSLAARVILGPDALGLTGGRLTLDEQVHGLEMRIGFGEEPRLDVVAQLGELGGQGSAILAALLPGIGNEPQFGNSFPEGSFAVNARSAEVLGQAGRELQAQGEWSPGQLRLERLAAADLGGVGLDAQLQLAGSLTEPVISGDGSVQIAAADAPALRAVYDLLAVPEGWRQWLAGSAPADLRFDLAAPVDGGAQSLTLDGTLGTAALHGRAELSGGLNGALSAPVRLQANLESTDIEALTRQLGLGDAVVFSGSGSALVVAGLQGNAENGFTLGLNASLGEERVSFNGDVAVADTGELQGDGRIELALEDASGLAQVVGADGVSLPGVSVGAQLRFEGERVLALSEIGGQAGDAGFSGRLTRTRRGDAAALEGELTLEAASVEGIAATVFGPAALVGADGAWPEGPISAGAGGRGTRGSVRVTAEAISAGGAPLLRDAGWELAWDDNRLRLAGFTARAGNGEVRLDGAVCCSGALADKTVTGRLSVAGVDLAGLAPAGLASVLGGRLDGGVQFEGTGASLAGVAESLAGEGNFTLADFTAAGLDPDVFGTVAGLEDVLETPPETLTTLMGIALGEGPFRAPSVTGAFTIAGGVVRLGNLLAENPTARLAGSVDLDLRTLALQGRFALTPKGFVDPQGLVRDDTSQIFTAIGGTIGAPEVRLDLEPMVGAIQVRANEIEVDRLEALRIEDAERQRAAAEARNRLIEQQRQQRAAEEAARLAEEAAEAERLAEEEAERQRLEAEAEAEAEAAQEPIEEAPPALPQGPLNLEFTPLQVLPGASFGR